MKLLIGLILLFSLYLQTEAATCDLSTNQIKDLRMDMIRNIWIPKVDKSGAEYAEILNEYYAPEASLTVVVGTFGPKYVASEYGQILKQNPPATTITYQKIFEQSVNWLTDDRVIFDVLYGTDVDVDSDGVLDSGLRNLPQTVVIEFVPGKCGNLTESILSDFYSTEVYSARLYGIRSTNIEPTTICGLLSFICPSGSPFESYSSFPDCLNFMNQIPTAGKLCPNLFTSNTTACRILHGISATVDPPQTQEIHCPHAIKDSMVCYDRCITPCRECALLPGEPGSTLGYPEADPSTHAQCVIANRDYTIEDYACACKDGTINRGIVNGKLQCEPITCTKDSNCPVSFGTAKCINNQCVPQNGFQWDSSLTAFNSKNMAVCQYGTNQIFWENGKPYCMQTGYCRPGLDTVNRYQCQTVQQYENVKCTNVSTQDYGVALTFNRDFGCVCNYGFEGGYKYPCTCIAPKRQLWSNLYQGKGCFATNECTDNFHCTYPQTCQITSGSVVGTCT